MHSPLRSAVLGAYTIVLPPRKADQPADQRFDPVLRSATTVRAQHASGSRTASQLYLFRHTQYIPTTSLSLLCCNTILPVRTATTDSPFVRRRGPPIASNLGEGSTVAVVCSGDDTVRAPGRRDQSTAAPCDDRAPRA